MEGTVGVTISTIAVAILAVIAFCALIYAVDDYPEYVCADVDNRKGVRTLFPVRVLRSDPVVANWAMEARR